MSVIIPFVPSIGAYEFNIALPGGTKQSSPTPVVFKVRWNATAKAWYFDLYESDGETPIVYGVKIVLGVALCKTCSHFLFENIMLQAFDSSKQGRDATFDDLGTRVEVRLFTREEINGDPDDRSGNFVDV